MIDEETRKYHFDRARTELNMANRAKRAEVASAHLMLSSLHMQRAGANPEQAASTVPSPG